MVTISISLPDKMMEWVKTQAADGRYADSSDLMRDLIRKEQDTTDKIATLRAQFLEGRSSPSRTVNRDELLASIKNRPGVPHGMAAERPFRNVVNFDRVCQYW